MTTAPSEPAGSLQAIEEYDEATRRSLIDTLDQAPRQLRAAVAGLDADQLDTKYRNWTIRQIVHHLADSHIHSYIRFKWALTEDHPTIRAYEESDWAVLPDAIVGDIAPALALMDGIHAKWVQLLGTMTADQFERTFHHPQSGETVRLWTALNY